jgi:uncharacterized protein involved in exopolysaccharide biosynthesis
MDAANSSANSIFPQVTVRDLALVLFKRKWGIITVVAVTMIGFLAWLFLIRGDNYQVAVKVLVKIGREQAPPPSVMGASPLVIAYRSQDVNSEIEIFQNTELLARVVDELKLDQPVPQPPPVGFLATIKYNTKQVLRGIKGWYEETMIGLGMRERLTPREKTVYALQRGMEVKAQKDSNVFVGSILLPYRQGSARVLNTLVHEYLGYRQELYRSNEARFFQDAVDEASAKLKNAERTLQKFETAEGITAIDRQESILLEHVAAARQAWKEMDFTRQEFAGRVERLEAELAQNEPNFAGIAEFGYQGLQQTLVEQLADLQREREKLRLTELDSGDKIQNNRQQYRAIATMLTANLRTALKEKAEQTALRLASYENLQAQLRQLHDKQAQLSDLKRRSKDYEETYTLYRKKLEEAAANDALLLQRIGNVAVIERAMDPLAPAGLRKTTLLSLALLGAILAALSWVTIAEFFDDRIYSAEELQRQVQVPVLASISPGLRLDRERRKEKSRHSPMTIHGT